MTTATSYDIYLAICKTGHGTVYEVETTDASTISDEKRVIGPALVGPAGYDSDEDAIAALRLTDEYDAAKEAMESDTPAEPDWIAYTDDNGESWIKQLTEESEP